MQIGRFLKSEMAMQIAETKPELSALSLQFCGTTNVLIPFL